jgi:hypothetical protein
VASADLGRRGEIRAMNVVIDTNVFLSSFLSSRGSPRKIIDRWKHGDISWCLCAEIEAYYRDREDERAFGLTPHLHGHEGSIMEPVASELWMERIPSGSKRKDSTGTSSSFLYRSCQKVTSAVPRSATS